VSHYAIGDIQGCRAEFRQLLELIGFSERDDRLWLVGDLVNRGPESLPVLRDVKAWARGRHGSRQSRPAPLTVAAGHTKSHRQDTIAPILEAPDRDELLHWLARRPLVVAEGEKVLCTRACCRIGPRKRQSRFQRKSRRCSQASRRMRFSALSTATSPISGTTDLQGFDRLRAIVNACTRMRFCTDQA
jgi:bis(5'-nucleosyl)-tetraphosphatase (symmetrical)